MCPPAFGEDQVGVGISRETQEVRLIVFSPADWFRSRCFHSRNVAMVSTLGSPATNARIPSGGDSYAGFSMNNPCG